MTYSVYIRKDYKPLIRFRPDRPWYRRYGLRLPLFGGMFLAPFLLTIIPFTPWNAESQSTLSTIEIEFPSYRQLIRNPAGTTTLQAPALATTPSAPVDALEAPQHKNIEPANSIGPEWQSVTVTAGDNMSLIFDRLGLGPTELYKVLHSDKQTASLKNLVPGQELRFHIEADALQALEYDKDLTTTLLIEKHDDGYRSEVMTTPLEKKVVEAKATIHHSLYLAGKQAGMSDNLIMQLVALYGWDIDFAMHIREGDHFKVLYEQHYKDDVLVREGPILAAEFNNRSRTVRAVRYTDPAGNTDYYAEDGASMRKAFLRNPLDVFRISSHFNPRRRHPVLNTIRAHRGTDYAAPAGTPVRATGDGTIAHIGRKGGYGNAVVLRHGGRYSTLYGHMSRFAGGLRQGSRVSQGQVIGYVGQSGLATGPHLHYEFQVNGVHRNPITVKLPKADSVPEKYMDDFKLESRTLLAELDAGDEQKEQTILAMREEEPAEPRSPEKN